MVCSARRSVIEGDDHYRARGPSLDARAGGGTWWAVHEGTDRETPPPHPDPAAAPPRAPPPLRPGDRADRHRSLAVGLLPACPEPRPELRSSASVGHERRAPLHLFPVLPWPLSRD